MEKSNEIELVPYIEPIQFHLSQCMWRAPAEFESISSTDDYQLDSRLTRRALCSMLAVASAISGMIVTRLC